MGCLASSTQDSANDRVTEKTGLNEKTGVGEAVSANDQERIGSKTDGDRLERTLEQDAKGENADEKQTNQQTAKEE